MLHFRRVARDGAGLVTPHINQHTAVTKHIAGGGEGSVVHPGFATQRAHSLQFGQQGRVRTVVQVDRRRGRGQGRQGFDGFLVFR